MRGPWSKQEKLSQSVGQNKEQLTALYKPPCSRTFSFFASATKDKAVGRLRLLLGARYNCGDLAGGGQEGGGIRRMCFFCCSWILIIYEDSRTYGRCFPGVVLSGAGSGSGCGNVVEISRVWAWQGERDVSFPQAIHRRLYWKETLSIQRSLAYHGQGHARGYAAYIRQPAATPRRSRRRKSHGWMRSLS